MPKTVNNTALNISLRRKVVQQHYYSVYREAADLGDTQKPWKNGSSVCAGV
jgi:hypothetical protein